MDGSKRLIRRGRDTGKQPEVRDRDREQPGASATDRVRRNLYRRAQGIHSKRLDTRSNEAYAGSSQDHQNEDHQQGLDMQGGTDKEKEATRR
jgi:hypothetical protein